MRGDELDWVASVGCTGGPVMIVDLEDFAEWTGATPFTALRKGSKADAARFADRRNMLHFWGNLGGAGEQLVECANERDALAELEKLRQLVKANSPRVVISKKGELTHFRDPASGGELRAELGPKSEYDASCRLNMDADVWEHAFGRAARALFWFVGDDLVHIGRKGTRDEIVLLKQTFTDPSAWSMFDTTTVDPAFAGYTVFDGKTAYFLPSRGPENVVARYDTSAVRVRRVVGCGQAGVRSFRQRVRVRQFRRAVRVRVAAVVARGSLRHTSSARSCRLVVDVRYLEPRDRHLVPWRRLRWPIPTSCPPVGWSRFDAKSQPSMPSLPAFFGSFFWQKRLSRQKEGWRTSGPKRTAA
jgi:hypothetical protein